MPITTCISTQSYTPPPSCVSAINDTLKNAKPLRAMVGLATLVMAGIEQKALNTSVMTGAKPETPAFIPETQRSFSESVERNQRLDIDRLDLKILARIRAIGSYLDGWDDNNGRPATQQSISDAENFMWKLFPTVKEPFITLASDGEINFLWILPNFRLDLGIYGDGSYSYYGKTSGGEEFIADETPIDENLPEEILALITNKAA